MPDLCLRPGAPWFSTRAGPGDLRCGIDYDGWSDTMAVPGANGFEHFAAGDGETTAMRDQDKTKQQLLAELEQLRGRVATLEATDDELRAIYQGMFDGAAIVDVETSTWRG